MSDKKKPAPPKRPQCPFFIYKSEVYQQVKEANPGKKMTEITKIISEQYKKLDQTQIDDYEKKYQANKVVFEKDKKDYEAEHGKIKNERKKKKTKAAEGGAKPKKQPAAKKAKGKKATPKKDDSEDDDDHSDEKDDGEDDDDEE